MAKKLLLAGYFGFDNSGDDAILKAMVDNLKEMDKDLDITALSLDPKKTERQYNIKAVDRFSMSEVFKAMRNTDCFVFGGGSLLQDITSNRSLYYYLSILSMAKFLKKKTFVFANGIGPIDKKINRFLARKVLNGVDSITLRDKSSHSFVKYLGVENKKIDVTADPVFLLQSSSDERADEILEEQNIEIGDNVVGISVREWKESPNLNLEIAKFCDSLIDEDLDILIVPMHYPYDVSYSETIKELSNNKRIHVLNNKYEVEDIIALLRKCKVVLAMRLHALIYSAKANIPIVGLIYDPKVTGLIEELSISEYLKVEEVTGENLRQKYDSINKNLEEREKSIVVANERQENLARKTLELLEETLNA